jgi:hypothetical protein
VFNLADGLAGEGEGAGGPESQTVPSEPATRDGMSVLEATGDAEALMTRLRDFDAVVPDPSSATPGDTRIKVLNASGVDGAASTALDGFTAAGFEGAGTGNADQPLQTSEVHYPPGSEDEAALVAGFVSGPVQLVVDDSVEGADVTLYIGRSFGGVAAAPAPAPAEGIPQPASLAPVPGAC